MSRLTVRGRRLRDAIRVTLRLVGLLLAIAAVVVLAWTATPDPAPLPAGESETHAWGSAALFAGALFVVNATIVWLLMVLPDQLQRRRDVRIARTRMQMRDEVIAEEARKGWAKWEQAEPLVWSAEALDRLWSELEHVDRTGELSDGWDGR